MHNESVTKGGQDGRHLRSERSRGAIAKALLELVRETKSMPTTDAVADRAGVSRRSVFRHYADVSELLRAAYELQREDALSLYPPSNPEGWSHDERISNFVSRGCDLYEYVSSVRQAAVYMVRDYPIINDLMIEDDRLHRSVITKLFAPMIEACPQAERSALVEALVFASNWSSWNTLRVQQGLELEQARGVMKMALRALLNQTKAAA